MGKNAEGNFEVKTDAEQVLELVRRADIPAAGILRFSDAKKLLGGRSDVNELSQMLENDARRYSRTLCDENDVKTR